MFTYKPKTFDNLKGLKGISERQIKDHLTLYEGYVTNTNKLLEGIQKHMKQEETSSPEIAEMRRRLGYEFNGMILHEYYFENMAPGIKFEKNNRIRRAIEHNFGNYENWKKDFVSTGLLRGNGWAILYQNPVNGELVNFWIDEHQDGHPAGYRPILIMDVWEHAFALDYGVTPEDRKNYIDAFFQNIHWEIVDSRIAQAEFTEKVEASVKQSTS